MLTDCNFIEQSDGTFIINSDIGIKLCDFGVAEVFKLNNHQCTKRGLSLDNESKSEPKIFQSDNEIYDAQKADIWALGMLLFECATGRQLYHPSEIWDPMNHKESGYWALQNGKLAEYLMMNNYDQ